MDYQIRYSKSHTSKLAYFNKKSGLTIVELLIVIAIFTILFSLSSSVYNDYKSHSNLAVTANSVVEAMRFAQSGAQSGKGDSKWGVEILTNQITIFKGNSYAGRDISFDEDFVFANGVSASGLAEVIFDKLTGETSTVGTVTLTNGAESKNISINEKGTIIY